MAWNAARYLTFAGERTRPCRDLVARIELASPRSVVDLGCGPGNSTAVVSGTWPQAAITALDSSPEMLAEARRAQPAVEWLEGDIGHWAACAEPRFDLVFSNAALQWVPDHAVLIPSLLARVNPGGALAFQMPAASDVPAQRLIRELAASPAWRGRFSAVPADWRTESPGFYYDLLAPRCARADVWQTEYFHVMSDPEAIAEWYRGSGMRPFLNALAPDDRDRFLDEYVQALRQHYPPRTDGRILFPFARLFAIAYLA